MYPCRRVYIRGDLEQACFKAAIIQVWAKVLYLAPRSLATRDGTQEVENAIVIIFSEPTLEVSLLLIYPHWIICSRSSAVRGT